MLRECLEHLAPATGGTLVDATLGLGGHSRELLRAVGPTGRVIGLDRDPEALRRAEARLRAECSAWGWTECPLVPVHTDFRHLGEALDARGIGPVDGFLFDLGVSSMQLDFPERGFSFRSEGPLDMRMNPDADLTAAEFVNTRSELELARVLWEYGEERHSRKIARRIVEQRGKKPLSTTKELEELVWLSYPPQERRGRLHPATRTFQALRIAVNDELAALEPALRAAAARLRRGGRIVVLSYHSLEDRIVKRTFEFLAGKCQCPPELHGCACGARTIGRVLTRKPLEPSAEEIERNPRARSARLRAVEHL
jgi:16S rRNA (cytosine1402-N4)-methyltransferase